MPNYTEEIISGINVALNEATLLGVEFNREQEIIAVSFAPVALDESGNVPSDNRVQFIFKPIGRFIASYRLGHWDDKSAEIVRFEPEQILEILEEFGQSSIYGWEFIDCTKESDYHWLDTLSFDYNSKNTTGKLHSIELFQAGIDKHIDIKIWFDEFEIFSASYEKIEFKTFINNGKRAWDTIYSGDASDKFGIIPLKEDFDLSQHKEKTNNNTGVIIKEKQNFFAKFWKRLWR